jgi:hypothetical protein
MHVPRGLNRGSLCSAEKSELQTARRIFRLMLLIEESTMIKARLKRSRFSLF